MSGLARAAAALSWAVACQVQAAAAQPTAPPAAAPASDAAAATSVTAYGVVYFNGFHNTGGTNNVDIPLWALKGAGNASATARQTRFGLRASLPKTLGGKLGATIEADFFGGFPAIGTGENFPQLRLRLAHARIEWQRTSLVVGQDWMVFAPANPASLASAAIPLFAAAGNPWARLPQVGVEHRRGSGLLQAAILSPQSGDFSSPFLAQPSSGALAKWPSLQARIAFAPRSDTPGKRHSNVGISGHYGRSRITTSSGSSSRVASVGGAVDWTVPLGDHLLVSGEAYLGSNLGGFQSGVFQGVNPDAAGIHTRGAWAQVLASLGSSGVSLSAGFGIDDPDDDDLASASEGDWRLRNQVGALALSFRASKALSLGVEYRLLETHLLRSGTRRDRHLNLAAVLGF